jgi:hypothetical protein
LLPPGSSSVVFGGTSADRTVVLDPATDKNGTAVVTVTLRDLNDPPELDFVDTATLTLTVTGVNDPPEIRPLIGHARTPEDTPWEFEFTVTDKETPAADLDPTIVVGNDPPGNASLFTSFEITRDGSDSSKHTVNLVPAPDVFGETTVTITVGDGDNATTSHTFTFTIDNRPDAPEILTQFEDRSMREDESETFTIQVKDLDGIGTLTAYWESSDPGLFPAGSVFFHPLADGTHNDEVGFRSFTAIPSANNHGTALITITVAGPDYDPNDPDAPPADPTKDPFYASMSFQLTVQSVNDMPTMGFIPDQSMDEDTTKGPFTITIGDIETDLSDLVVTAAELDPDDPTQVITAGGGFDEILIESDQANGEHRNVTLTPKQDLYGVRYVRLTVSDGTDTVFAQRQYCGLRQGL